MRHYNIRFCVHDALPNEHNAQEFAEAFKGRVALKYDSGERAKLFTYDEQSNKLVLSRTMNFDGLLDDIKKKSAKDAMAAFRLLVCGARQDQTTSRTPGRIAEWRILSGQPTACRSR